MLLPLRAKGDRGRRRARLCRAAMRGALTVEFVCKATLHVLHVAQNGVQFLGRQLLEHLGDFLTRTDGLGGHNEIIAETQLTRNGTHSP